MLQNTDIKPITGVALGAAAAAFYTTPSASTKAFAKKLLFHNTDAVARTVHLYAVPNGGVPGVANKIGELKIGAKATYPWREEIALGGLWSLQAYADAAGVVSVNGMVTEFEDV